MPRPIVAVFQEYASVSFTPAEADLNTCIAAVAKQVVDYDALNEAATLAVVPGRAPNAKDRLAVFNRLGFSSTVSGKQAGAILESATVALKNAEQEILFRAEAKLAPSPGLGGVLNVVSLDSATGISVGDAVVINGIQRGAIAEVDGVKFRLTAAAGDIADLQNGGQLITVGGISRGTVVKTTADGEDTWVEVTDAGAKNTETPTFVKPGDKVYVDGVFVGAVTNVNSNQSLSVVNTFGDKPNGTPYAAQDVLPNVVVTRPLSGIVRLDDAHVSVDPATDTVTVGDIPPGGGLMSSTGRRVGAAAEVHVEFVARRTDLNKFLDVKSAADVEGVLGPVDPRNPLALAAWVALQNTGSKVIAYGVTEDTLNGYAAFQKAVAPKSDIYCVVPVCLNPSTQLAVVKAMKAKFQDMADPQNALTKGVPQRFKMVVAGGFAIENPAVVTTADDVTSYTLAEPTGGAPGIYRLTSPTAKFIDSGVRVKDRVTNGAVSGIVESVVSNDAIIATASFTGIMDVERDLDTAGRVTALSGVPAGVASKRAVMLLGDTVTVPSEITDAPVSAAYLGAAVGGMIAGLPPHSGITNLSLAGVDDIHGTSTDFDEEQLTVLSDAGWCVFAEKEASYAPYCIHGVTTDPSALEFSEIMSVKNFDYVATVLSNQLNGFIGTWNLNEETLGFISSSLSSAITRLKERRVYRLGAPVIEGTITSLAPHATEKDRAEVFIELVMPKTLNRIGLHLVSV